MGATQWLNVTETINIDQLQAYSICVSVQTNNDNLLLKVLVLLDEVTIKLWLSMSLLKHMIDGLNVAQNAWKVEN